MCSCFLFFIISLSRILTLFFDTYLCQLLTSNSFSNKSSRTTSPHTLCDHLILNSVFHLYYQRVLRRNNNFRQSRAKSDPLLAPQLEKRKQIKSLLGQISLQGLYQGTEPVPGPPEPYLFPVFFSSWNLRSWI